LAIALLPLNTPLPPIVELATQLEANPQVLSLAVQQQLQASAQDRFLLVIDQFEELFTLCTNESHRQKFIEALVTAAHNSQKQLTVIIALRADFYSDCLAHPNLRTLMRQYQEPIGAMSRAELLEAILRPTALHGWRIQEGLAELMLDEVGREPGGLPLLAHALLETWHRRRGRTLTLSGYREAGGVRGAIAQTAESAYRRFSEAEQEIARTIFLRLTDLGLRVQETRRRITIASMQVQEVRPEQVRAVLQTLADARLITIDEGEVEVAHEALIREWPTLRNWLEADREGLIIHQRLEEAADEWERLGRDAGVLYRGAQLAQLEVWMAHNQRALNASERAFWQASVAEQERRTAEREEQRLTAEKLQTQQRIGRILRWATIVVGIFLVIAVIAAVLATNARGQAEDNFNLAVTRETQANAESTRALNAEALAVAAQQTSEANAQIALTQEAAAVVAKATSDVNAALAATREGEANVARDALAEQRLFTLAQSLAAQAPQLADADQGTDLALLLAVQAYRFNERVGPGAEFLIDHTLRELLNRSTTQTVFHGHESLITDAYFTADGQYAVSLDDTGVVIVWPLNDPTKAPQQLGTEVEAIGVSADGRYLYGALFLAGIGRWALADLTAEPQIFLPANDRQEFITGNLDTLSTLDNTRLKMITSPTTGDLFVSTFGGLKRYQGDNLTADSQSFATLDGIAGQALAVSQDGRWLAVGGFDGYTYLLDLTAAEPEAQQLDRYQIAVHDVALTPDNQRLFAAGADSQIIVWSLGEEPPLPTTFFDHTSSLYALALSPDGRWLAAGDEFGLILLWDLENPNQPPQTLDSHNDDVTSLQFSQDGNRLLSASRDQTVRVWELAGVNNSFNAWPHSAGLTLLEYAPNGRFWAFSDSNNRINVRFLDDLAAPVMQFAAHEARIRSLAVAPDNQTIAAIDDAGALRLWSTNGDVARPLLYTFTEASSSPAVAWHPQEMMLAAVHNNKLYLWSSLDSKPLIRQPDTDRSNDAVGAVAFSPTGEQLAVGYLSGEIHLWEINDLEAGEPRIIPTTRNYFLFGNLTFSPDGQQLAAGFDDNIVRVWSVPDLEQEPQLFEGHFNTVLEVDFDPSGRYLAASGLGNTILIWQTDHPTLPPIEIQRANRVIPALAFAPDGQRLVSIEDNFVYTWPLLEQLVTAACVTVNRNLTPQEWSRYLGQLPYEES
ncbi:MAG: hypothetical protein KDE51_13200, partial [Anaerolineales bacterium]|nr:hypothetical protein [Anaerolineales bacterium]